MKLLNEDILNVTPLAEKEQLKLIKYVRGYGWEIKIKDEHLNEETLKRLKKLDDALKDTYGSEPL